MNDYPDPSELDSPTPPPDPNSPERVKAAKFAVASVVCMLLKFVFFGVLFLFALTMPNGISVGVWMACFLLLVASVILQGTFKNQELMLRCTHRTTAHCIYTVRRRSGKSNRRYPVVEYEVEGVTHTAELSVRCSRRAEGELYTIYYDPLDPQTVRSD